MRFLKRNTILLDSIFLLMVTFFMHYPWNNPIENIVFMPSFAVIFIALYEDMKKWAKHRKRKKNLERFTL